MRLRIYVVHFIFYVLHDGYIVVVYVTLCIVLYHRTTSHLDSQISGYVGSLSRFRRFFYYINKFNCCNCLYFTPRVPGAWKSGRDISSADRRLQIDEY